MRLGLAAEETIYHRPAPSDYSDNFHLDRMRQMTGFYVYIHTRNDTDEVFYVGKGKEYRHIAIDNRNKHWNNVVAKHGFTAYILDSFEHESDAFAMERFLIASYKACGATLTNQTDGGEGMSGYSHTQESKHAISNTLKEQRKGRPMPDECLKKAAEANRTRVRSPEEVELRRTAMLGNTNGRYLAGVPKSEATKENMRRGWIKRKASRTD